MSATDQVYIMFLNKTVDDIWAECERDTTVILAPADYISVWICPEEVT